MTNDMTVAAPTAPANYPADLNQSIYRPEYDEKRVGKYIDEVIRRINSGEVKGISFYPQAVARTLLHESDGKLDIDTSALKQTEEE